MASFIRSRNLERIFLFSLGAVLLYLFLHLFDGLRKDFEEVPNRLADGSMIDLNGPKPADNLASMLQRGFYFEDPRDIELIRSVTANGLTGTQEMDNIGELNKKAFDITTDDAFTKGGASFRRRATTSRILLGFSGNDSMRFDAERRNPPQLPASVNIGMGQHAINGKVQTPENTASAGVLMRLQMILPQDSVFCESIEAEGRTIVD